MGRKPIRRVGCDDRYLQRDERGWYDDPMGAVCAKKHSCRRDPTSVFYMGKVFQEGYGGKRVTHPRLGSQTHKEKHCVGVLTLLRHRYQTMVNPQHGKHSWNYTILPHYCARKRLLFFEQHQHGSRGTMSHL